MRLLFLISFRHILARKRQSIVSLSGILLGVAFFLAISALMQGSEKDFIKRLIDNSPHITIYDEYRKSSAQPVFKKFPSAAIELRSLKPISEPRGIRNHEIILQELRQNPAVDTSSVLEGQALLSFAGRDYGVTLNGMVAAEMQTVTTVEEHMIKGTTSDLIANPDGIVIGEALAEQLAVNMGENLPVSTTAGQSKNFKVVGIFRTGRAAFDERQVFATISRVQSLMARPNRVNRILVKLSDPYQAYEIAQSLENKNKYKSVSWQETSEDILNTLVVRNIIMYTVVSSVLLVAGFGIYNVISTVVLEKQREIAILRSMGFLASDVKIIFLIQGLLLGSTGILMGLPLGSLFMWILSLITFKPPGSSEAISMPIDWGFAQFLLASAFAMLASVAAAYLPARKAAELQPVEILRGNH